MALDTLDSVSNKPTLYKSLLHFGNTLHSSEKFCLDEASAKFLIGTAFLGLSRDLSAEFGHIETDQTPSETVQIPVMAKPMQALIPLLRSESTKLLDGSDRSKTIEHAYFQLIEFKERFVISAEVVETLVSFIKPLKDKNFEHRSITNESVSRFAATVAQLLPSDQTPESLSVANGPNQALIAHAVSHYFPKTSTVPSATNSNNPLDTISEGKAA